MATDLHEQRLHERERATYGTGRHLHDGRSLTDLIKELRDETTAPMRHEVALAKSEMSEKASRVAPDSGYLTVGGAIAYAGLLVLLAAAVAGLWVGLVAWGVSTATSAWLSPLIIGLIVVVIGYVMAQKAISTLRRESIVPQRTVDSLKRDKDWMKEKVE